MFEIAIGLFIGYLFGIILPITKGELSSEEVERLYPIGQPFVVYGGPGGHTSRNALWLKHFANNIRRYQ